MESEAIKAAVHILLNFAVIFIVGAFLAKLADYIKVPDVALFLLAGVFLGPSVLNLVSIPADSTVNQLALTLGASVLLFQGGTEVRFSTLRQVWITLLLLSTVAVLGMVLIVGVTAHFVLGMSMVFAFLLAAIIAATDPATLVPVFLSVKIKERLKQTVLSESAFNDATASIATFAILGIITTGQLSLSSIGLKLVIMAGGGIIIGAAYGLVGVFLVSNKTKYFLGQFTRLLLLPVIIGAYLTADHIGASGFMAVFVAGLIFANFDAFGWKMKEDTTEDIHTFIDTASLLLRITIFVLLGSNVNFGILLQNLGPGLIVIAVFMFIARPIVVLLCTLPDRKAKWQRNEILFMFWTRETGVIPAALAGMLLAMKIENAELISSIVFLAAFATILIQATTTRFLAGRLNLLETGEHNHLEIKNEG